VFGSKQTIVKEFKSRRQMQRVAERLGGQGYRITNQSGEFPHNPFTLRWNRKRVVVTFERAPQT